LLGVETMLPLMLTEVHRGRLTLNRLVALCSESPAKVWDLYPRKGALHVGSDADIVLVDMDRSASIDQAKLHSKQKISGWHGRFVHGIPVRTIVRGKTVVLNGELIGPVGWGKRVQQTKAASANNKNPMNAAAAE
jgi:dihydroorotase-like cyclic amidohydrolase